MWKEDAISTHSLVFSVDSMATEAHIYHAYIHVLILYFSFSDCDINHIKETHASSSNGVLYMEYEQRMKNKKQGSTGFKDFSIRLLAVSICTCNASRWRDASEL